MAYDDDDDGPAPSFAPTSWHGKSMEQLLSTPRGLAVPNSDELTRVLNLPRRPVVSEGTPTAEALVELGMRKYSRGERQCRCAEIDRRIKLGKRKCVKRLKWQQAWALYEMSVVGGLAASAPVGLGKTLLNILAALAIKDCKLALLMIPPSLRAQITTDYQLIAEHFHVPNFVVHMPGRKTWRSATQYRPDGKTMAPTVHVVPYNFISGEQNSQWIESLRPDVIICDEVDALADVESSRTMRVLRYFEQYGATTKFCGWTGSLTDSSVSEFAHIYAFALKWRSPLPVIKKDIDDWSGALDAVENPRPIGALTRLLEPHETSAQIRQAFHRRLAQTAGIIMIGGRQIIRTDAGEIVENDIREKIAPKIPPKVLEALYKIRNNLRPDSLVSEEKDEIILDPLEQARYVRQIATGVFYVWNWKGIPREVSLEWLARRRAWYSELRSKMLRGEVLLDSEKLCTDAAKRAWGDLPKDPSLPEWKADAWPDWRDFKDRCDPSTEAKWLDEFLVHDAADWACSNKGIVWYGMREFAQKLGKLTGLRVFGEGSGAELARGLETGQITGEDTILASIASHGRGTNGLQYIYDTQAVVNTFASARRYQQCLGRLCRDGQQSARVSMEVYLHTQELRATFEDALVKADYVQDVTSEEQMLIRGWRGYHCELGHYQ